MIPIHSIYLQGALIWLAVTVVAFLVGRFSPNRRSSIRRIVIPAGLLTVLATAHHLLPAHFWGSFQEALGHTIWLVYWVLVINGATLLLFELLLRRLTALSRIAQELAQGASYLVLLFIFLRPFGVDFSSLLATSAVVTGIVALSMQSTLGNAFGGLTGELDQSVTEGDWIRHGRNVLITGATSGIGEATVLLLSGRTPSPSLST